MKKLLLALLLVGCTPDDLELVRGDDPIPGWACTESVAGYPCDRDDKFPGVCAGPRSCLIECDNDADCDPYAELQCELGVCR